MTQATAPAQRARPSRLPSLVLFLKATELDTRMLGMIGALLLIWIAFHVLSGGLFLTPRNLWNLSVQSSSVAIMATGMALVIVTRNIDLSIGSMLGFVGMVMGVIQADLLPKSLHEAIDALQRDTFFREKLGAQFVDYYVHIKNAEIERFQAEVSDWEHREYFEMF